MNLDLDTLQIIRQFIKKQIDRVKDDLVYHVDTIDKLQYSRGRLNALEALLQDLKDLQNKTENIDEVNSDT
jgi:hypothetical protein|tara:strand:+ start:2044 stop:2256 length:213 start_codon:yes stop_codon:yes gene_type:complete